MSHLVLIFNVNLLELYQWGRGSRDIQNSRKNVVSVPVKHDFLFFQQMVLLSKLGSLEVVLAEEEYLEKKRSVWHSNFASRWHCQSFTSDPPSFFRCILLLPCNTNPWRDISDNGMITCSFANFEICSRRFLVTMYKLYS